MGVPDGGAQGFLVPQEEGGFRIEVDPEPAGGWKSVAPGLRRSLERHRKRFLVAHELAHTLFFEAGPQGPRRLVLDGARQEEFCDEFARALLVPEEIAAQLPFAPESVVELQRRFDVSIELALRGLAAAHDGIGWLLVQREDKTLIQWDSAGPNRTARSLGALRKLARRAAQTAGEVTMPLGRDGYGRALHLTGREQAIVTWRRSVG
jgi:hypothetical protein